MESRINYTIVGLFVVLLFTGLVTFAYWLMKYGGGQKYDHYYVYMSESVAGLSTGASVKFMGVDVGIVEHIGINPKNPEKVEILLKIRHGTPIKVDTRAKLQSFGITGLTFIELTGGSKGAPVLQKTGNKIPVIPEGPSTFTQIDESLRALSERSILALDKINRLLSKKNLDNVESILLETKMLTRDMRGQLQGFHDLVDNGIVMERHVIEASARVKEASASVKKTAECIERNYADVGRNVSMDARQALESLNHLLYQLDILTEDLQETIRNFEASPSDLLFKYSRPRPGPGEKGYNEK